MKLYELLYIIKHDFSDDQAPKIANEIIEMLKKDTPVFALKEQQLFGRRKFAYQIEHTGQGFYVMVDFESETKDITKFNRLLELNDKILRHIIVIKEIKSQDQIAREKEIKNSFPGQSRDRKQAETTAKPAKPSPLVQRPEEIDKTKKTAPVDDEKLDERLDEILKRDIV